MQYDFYSWQSLPLSFMHWVTRVFLMLCFVFISVKWMHYLDVVPAVVDSIYLH